MRSCVWCKKEISPTRLPFVKYCSLTCSKLKARHDYHSKNGTVKGEIPSLTVGTISELVVAVDLLSRGYGVFKALSPSSCCDLAVLSGRLLIRVEVTTGHYSASGKPTYLRAKERQRENDRYDILAVVLTDQVLYIPPLPPPNGPIQSSAIWKVEG